MADQGPVESQPDLQRERWELLQHIEELTDKPMLVLAFVWLALLILDFTRGLGPLLQIATWAIWALFVLDFAIEIVIAPDRSAYLRRNWLTVLSLMLPAFRVLRVFRALRLLRAVRAARSVSLLRLITSLNRGMRALGRTLSRRGLGYLVALTTIVTFGGAAGMVLFENPTALRQAGYLEAAQSGAGLDSYGEAVWWTAMIMTTLGSEYWPKTVEGRILGWLLSVYALAIFGYITATIASYFIGQEATARQAQPPAAEPAALQAEIVALREQVATLVTRLEGRPAPHLPDKKGSEQQR